MLVQVGWCKCWGVMVLGEGSESLELEIATREWMLRTAEFQTELELQSPYSVLVAKRTLMDDEMWWIGRHVTDGLYIFLWHKEWLMLCWIGLKTQHCNMGLFPESQKSPIIFSLLKASAEKAFVSNTGGIQAATGRRGGGGGEECMGGLLVDRTAGTEPPCLAGTGKIPLHTNHTSFFLSSTSFAAFLSLFLLLLLFTAGYCCARETLMGWADSTYTQVSWLAQRSTLFSDAY